MWGHMSTTDLPGSTLLAGRCRLVERLGAGGMAVVWRGFDEVLGRQVAVKVLPPSTSADPSFRRRLRAEAQAAARLSHPHITNVYDYGEAVTADGEAMPYVLMELVDGESLAAVLARVRRLPWPVAVRITSEVSAALAAAHARGIVHRDVTPANVMLTTSGAKVVDFGISALIGENDIGPDGSLLGTPAYLAPERLEGGQVSPATDVYAVGLLMYRMLLGQLPWDVGTTTALLRAHQYTEPEPLPYIEGLPHEVKALVVQCLEKRPAARPSSADLAKAMGRLSAGTPGFESEWADNSEDTTILPAQQPYTSDNIGRHAVPPPPAAPLPPALLAAPLSGRVSLDPPVSPALGFSVVPGPAAAGAEPPARRASMPRNSRFGGSARPVAAGAAAFPSGPVRPLRPSFDGSDDRIVAGKKMASLGKNNRFGWKLTPGARRISILAGTVVVLALVTWSWSVMASQQHDSANEGPTVVPASGKCVVSYTVVTQDPKTNTFTASLIVANRDSVAVPDLNLWWIMPGDQVLAGNGREKVFQQDRGVHVSSADTLAPQQTKTLTFTGHYKTSNAAPMAFQLGKETCQAYVGTRPGEAPRPVEQLSDGTTRFGPLPTSADPQLGISTTFTGRPPTTSKPATESVASTEPVNSVTTSPATRKSSDPPATPPGDVTDSGDPTTSPPTTPAPDET